MALCRSITPSSPRPSPRLRWSFRSAIVCRMSFGQHLRQVYTARPNPSLNADVPRAGLRPRAGRRLACIVRPRQITNAGARVIRLCRRVLRSPSVICARPRASESLCSFWPVPVRSVVIAPSVRGRAEMCCLERLRQFHDPWPNPSLNADVPHAGLRPRSGPPVSLIR